MKDKHKEDSHNMHHANCSCSAMGRRGFLKTGLIAGGGLLLPGDLSANSIQDMSGKVFINRRFASPGSAVNPGDTVTVAHGGHASFTVNEDAYLLRGGSSLTIEPDSGVLRKGLRLLTGAVLAVFGEGSQQIRTRTATIGIRGTGLYLDTSPKKTYFCTCYGETELRVNGMDTRVISATHHSAVMLYTPANDVPNLHEMAGFEDHSDDELRALEKLHGRNVPFDR